MARTPADRTTQTSLREQLTEVGTFLAEANRPDLAAHVDEVLAPRGWQQLRATDPSLQEENTNFSISLPARIKDQILEASEADPPGTTLAARVNTGFTEYLAGRFTVPTAVEPRPVEPEAQANINVRAPKSLAMQVTEKIRRESSDRRASAARVAAEYLMFVYKVGRYAQDGSRRPMLSRGAARNPEMPRRIRDQIRAAAAASGDWVDDIVNEGYQKFLDGEFDPQPPVWSSEDEADLVVLKMRPNDELFAKVKAALTGNKHPVLNGRTGPRAVAVAYLLEEFGLTGEAGTE